MIKKIAFFTLLTLAMAVQVVAQESKEPKRPPITGVAHAAFFTKDVESTRQFYKNFLG